MNCPHCSTPNDPENRFCVTCGRDIHVSRAQIQSPRSVLLIQSARLFLALFGLAVLNVVLTGLEFVEELMVPELGLSTPAVITILIYTISIILLLNFARLLGYLWPQAFPRYPELIVLINAIIYLFAFTAVYKGLKQLIIAYATDAVLLTLLQVGLLIVTVVMLIRASIIVYNALPGWLANLRWQAPVLAEKEN